MLNQDQETPLCLASHRGWRDIVDLLLDSGSDITHRDREGSTALHRAARSGHLTTVKLLLQRGADVNLCDSSDKTPLDLARSYGIRDVVILLEDHTEDMYSQGRTAPSHNPLSQRSTAVIRRRRWQYRH
jgi:ankyrin repeat protein